MADTGVNCVIYSRPMRRTSTSRRRGFPANISSMLSSASIQHRHMPSGTSAQCQKLAKTNCYKNVYRVFIASLLMHLCSRTILCQSQTPPLSHDCPSLPPFYQVFCGNPANARECVLELWLCDGKSDCSNGLDESAETCNGGDPCRNVPCQNGGLCEGFPAVLHVSVAYFVCTCPLGFTGYLCEIISPIPSTRRPTPTTPRIPTLAPTTLHPATSSHRDLSTTSLTSILSSSSSVKVVSSSPRPTPDTNSPVTTTISGSTISSAVTLQPTLPTPNPASCNVNPCLNGVCTALRNGFHCNCRPGFGGRLCLTGSDPCASEPCCNGGKCRNQGDTYVCSCPLGFFGRQCDLEQNECESLPCLNQGTCTDGLGQYICACHPGYAGQRCEFNVDDCASSPCYLAAGGRCIDGVNSFTCECPASRAGERCERQQLCTNGDPCQNYALCYPTADPSQPQCYCPAGLTGRFCEVNLDDCRANPCGVHGQCLDGINIYRCVCDPGFSGRQCEIELDPCVPNPCQNQGYCCRKGKSWCSSRLAVGYFECYCATGFTGSRCEKRASPCTPDPCQNGGWCTQQGSGYHCTCKIIHTGIHCEVPVPCASQPCVNNAVCLDQGNGDFTCQCGPDQYGKFCELTLPCLRQPCKNDGQCTNQGSQFTCDCPSTHTGPTCEVYIPCSSGPCRNGGLCNNRGTSYTCTCGEGYTGRNCEYFLPCSSDPCLNGGVCTQDFIAGTYSCECPVDYTGSRCESFLPCYSNPCVNGGTCVTSGARFLCECTPAYGGPTCEQFLPCSSSPCNNGGSCSNEGLSYRCRCPATHTGPRCNTYLPCFSNPCLNNGKCLETDAGYACQCTDSYSGDRCSIFRQCSISPCLNSGTCTDLPDGQFRCVCSVRYTGALCDLPAACEPNPCFGTATCTTGSAGAPYLCICPDLYRGQRCEIFDPCLSAPCRNGGNCVAERSFYTCECLSSYTGQNCESLLTCSSRPCLNGGTCNELTGQDYSCECTNVYTGRNCQTFVPCGSNPCQNGGNCINGVTTFECNCVDNYGGRTCSVIRPCAYDPCVRGTCINGEGSSYRCRCEPGFTGKDCDGIMECRTNTCVNGVCQRRGDFFICVCEPNYTGFQCESPVSPCDSSPCFNGGTCFAPSHDTFTCTCPSNFTGSQCDSRILPCDSSPCLNGATCTNIAGASEFFCTCVKPYTGAQCELVEDACFSEPCLNGGRCIDDPTVGFDCVCQPPFRGVLCRDQVTSCVPNPCEAGGACMSDALGVFCRCPPDWEGIFCQLRVGLCTPNPCFNGGQCWQVAGRTACECLKGFQGPTCLNRVIGCNPNPCNEGGCVEGSHGQFQCECPPNFIGRRCEIPNPCFSQPCQFGGNCVTSVNGFRCFCRPGYTGPRCATPLAACTSAPCLHGGTCRDFGSTTSYICFCGPGFTGTNCEVDIDDCLGNRLCQNGATCVDLPNSFRCDCTPGYSGLYCSLRDTCVTEPCMNGARCENVANPVYGTDYTCRCPTAYVGANCAQVDFCRTQPCLNGGTCTNEPTRFRCRCDAGYSGDICRDQATGCDGITCNGRGQCVAVGLAGFRCECTQGYTGTQCELSPCSTQACQNQGTCDVTERGYVCTCPAPWAGITCQTRVRTLVPRFWGESYMRFPTPKMVTTATTISFQVYPRAPTGLLLYASQPSASAQRDFLLLGLRQGRALVQINLGSGVLTLDGPAIQLNQWHTIHMSRRGRVVSLSVGAGAPLVGVEGARVQGETPGDNSGLTLGGPLLVGATPSPDQLHPLVVVSQGFTGCIMEIEVGGERSVLLPWSSAEVSRNVSECTSSPCQPNPCSNGAICRLKQDTIVFCLCMLGFYGDRCQKTLGTLTQPSFTGEGYLASPAMFTTLTKRPTITVTVRPLALDGLVLFNFEFNDYIAITLEEGQAVLTFDLGTGPGYVKSAGRLSLKKWHKIRVTLTGREGRLQLDDAPEVKGMAVGGGLDQGVGAITYLGGAPRDVRVPPAVKVGTGFVGCIDSVTVHARPLLWTSALGGAGVTQCLYPACESHRCASGATCVMSQVAVEGYRCICPPGLTGRFCESTVCDVLPPDERCKNGATCHVTPVGSADCLCKLSYTGKTCTEALEFTVAEFRRLSYLAYNSSLFVGTQFFGVRLVFRTTVTDGLLLWAGQMSSEYLVLGVRDGVLDLRLNVGHGMLVINTQFLNVSLNQWYQVAAMQSGRTITLDITDSQGRVTQFVGQLPGSDLQVTLTPGLLYIGGVPGEVSAVTSDLYNSGLDGCVLLLQLTMMEDMWRDINLRQMAVDGRAITPCEV